MTSLTTNHQPITAEQTMKTLIVTGGTGGLGSTVVSRLSRDYHCILLHRGAEPIVDGFKAELTNEVSVRAAIGGAVDRFGAPYGLVHPLGRPAARHATGRQISRPKSKAQE